jgi:excisionase family DNA binding protein
MKKLMPGEVARRFNVSVSTVYFWIRSGKLKAERVSEARGDIYQISESTLKTFKRPSTGRPKKGSKK